MITPLLHVGHVKTATTFLQEHVFSDSDFGFGLAGDNENRTIMTNNIIINDALSTDIEQLRATFKEYEENKASLGLVPVWSEETLIGDPTSRRYDRRQNVHIISNIWQKAKILITIRNQFPMVLSLYNEYIHSGGTLPLREFIGTGKEEPSYSPILRESYLYFDEVVAEFQRLYGSENVLVLPVEQLRTEPQTYLRRLSEFAGTPCPTALTKSRSRVSAGAASLRFNRLLNRFAPFNPRIPFHQSTRKRAVVRAVNAFDRLMPKLVDRHTRRRQEALVSDRYRDSFASSNQALASLTGLDLERYGYSV